MTIYKDDIAGAFVMFDTLSACSRVTMLALAEDMNTLYYKIITLLYTSIFNLHFIHDIHTECLLRKRKSRRLVLKQVSDSIK